MANANNDFKQPGFYNNSRYFIPKKEVRHIAFYGQTRSGKTVNTMGWVTQAFSYCHHKVWYLWDGQRGENCFFLLPSRFRKWIRGWEDKYGNVHRSKVYPCTLFYPNNRRLPKELPAPSKRFTIPIPSLEIEDIRSIVGLDITKNEEDIWNSIKENYVDEHTSAHELLRSISTIAKRKIIHVKEGYTTPEITSHGIKTIFNAIKRLADEKIITSGDCETCINIWEEYKKPEIFSLVLTHIENWLAKFVLQWMVRNIFDTLSKRKHKKASTIVLDEAWQIIPKNTITPQEVIIKNIVDKVLVQGIGSANLYFIIGTQIPTEIDMAGGQMGICVVHKTAGAEDIAYFMITESKAWFTAEDRRAIPHLETGNCFIFTDKGRFYVHAIPPQCRIKHADDDFIDLWKKIAPSLGWTEPMKDTSSTIKKIEEDYQNGIKKNLEEIEIIKNKKKAKEELIKMREEEEIRKRKEAEEEEEQKKEEKRLEHIKKREELKAKIEEEKRLKKEKARERLLSTKQKLQDAENKEYDKDIDIDINIGQNTVASEKETTEEKQDKKQKLKKENDEILNELLADDGELEDSDFLS
jgi:hypothetical protein